MDQLTGLDNSFLLMETGAALGHVGSYATFDASDLAQGEFYAAFRKTLEERLHLLPPYRRKLAEVPLGLDRPYWVEDEDFDLDFHVRHIAVPPPGDREQQAALVARLHSRPLDRARPLWEVYVIEGLADGRVGFYSKVHHATIDGVSGSQMMEKLLDRDPNGDVVEPPHVPQHTRADREEQPLGQPAVLQRAVAEVEQRQRLVACDLCVVVVLDVVVPV